MTLTTDDFFQGLKVRKSLDRSTRRDAGALLSKGKEDAELVDARTRMEMHAWMTPAHIDSLILDEEADGWNVVLTFKDLPRGVPNVLSASRKLQTRQEAEREAYLLLRAAHVACAETNARGSAIEDIRIFRYQDLNLHVPGEMVDAAAETVPEDLPDDEALKAVGTQIDRLRRAMGADRMTLERWEDTGEAARLEAVTAAAVLLCLNINRST